MASITTVAIVVGASIFAYLILYFIMGYLEKPKHPRVAATINIVGGFILLMALAGLFIYFFILSPTFVEKPYMEKPLLETETLSQGQVVIQEPHVKYIVNEMGGYRLHEDPLTKTKPEFKFYLTDINATYNVAVIDNRVYISDEEPAKPDAEVYTTQQVAIQLFQSSDFKEELVSLVKEGKITARIIADKTTLALKGYLSLYDEINK